MNLSSAPMFEESFLPNLAIFAAGQLVAYLFLRTGRRSRGLSLMIGGWVFADTALVLKFGFQRTGGWFLLALLGMQIWSLYEVASFTFQRWRRRRRATLAEREKLFRLAFVHYLRDETSPAIDAYRRILRSDPWDVHTTLALATALARRGETRKASARNRAARSLDTAHTYEGVIRDELARAVLARRSKREP